MDLSISLSEQFFITLHKTRKNKIKLKKKIAFNMKIQVSFIECELKSTEGETEGETVAGDGEQKIT